MAHHNHELETRVETDASDGVTAGVLSQLRHDGLTWCPVAFRSRTMNDAEMRYEIHDKKMLAVIHAVKEWRSMLLGLQKPFLVITDHRVLEYFSTKRLLNARQARWLDVISEHHFKITYRPGSENIVADSLSRKQDELKRRGGSRQQHPPQMVTRCLSHRQQRRMIEDLLYNQFK